MLVLAVMISGCGMFSRPEKFRGESEVTVLKVISPNEYRVTDGHRERTVHLMGVDDMKKGHPAMDAAMRALVGKNGINAFVRFYGKDLFQAGKMKVLMFYNRPHSIIPETGSETETEGALLNEEVLKMGYGRFVETRIKIPDKYRDALFRAGKEAQNAGFGVWKKAFIE